jgi:hypothetical protein
MNSQINVRLGAVLALVLTGGFAATAQEADTSAQTNEVMQAAAAAVEAAVATAADDQTAANGVEPADDSTPGEEMISTNGAGSNNSIAPGASERRNGREARNQRFRRQRSGQSNGSGGGNGSGATNGGPVSLDYSAFNLVNTRNIFDPNRYAPGKYAGPPRRTTESFSLVGIMSYEKGTFAFFSGSSREYEKALKTSDNIAGYKLTAITPNSVKLAQATNEVELRVGMQMRREEDGPWTPSTGSALSAAATAPASATASPSQSVPSGPDSDIIKRMMQRREKE